MIKKENSLIFTLFMQFVICIVLFFSLYALKGANPVAFGDIKSAFFSKLSHNFSYVDSIKDQAFNKENSKFTENTTQESEEEATFEPVSDGKTLQSTTDGEIKEIEFLSADVNENENGNENEKNLPSNVSVASYTLNQKIVEPIKDGVITSKFGLRVHPVYNEERFHAGIDIAAPENTPIYASFSGVVKVASYDQWNGYYIKLLHEGDIMTVYCHCSKLLVKEGDTVSAGEEIAYVGSTGVSTGPHLHYELRVRDVSYNPEIAFEVSADEL